MKSNLAQRSTLAPSVYVTISLQKVGKMYEALKKIIFKRSCLYPPGVQKPRLYCLGVQTGFAKALTIEFY